MNVRTKVFTTIATLAVALSTPAVAQVGEVVYDNPFQPPGFQLGFGDGEELADDLHLTRSGVLTSFTFSAFATADAPYDAIVRFYANDPLDATLPGAATLLLEVTVQDLPADVTSTETIDLAAADQVAVPADIWMSVELSGVNTGSALVDITTPTVGSSHDVFWSSSFGVFDSFGDNAFFTVRLAEEGQQNTPPVITCGDPTTLWSPNHALIDVSDGLFTVDDADGDAVTVTVEVVSDENELPETGDGTGKHAPDFKTQLEDGTEGFFLRSERQGPSNGRVYLVVITADDGTDVVTHVCVAAVCPHDENGDSEAQVLAEAETRRADLEAALATMSLPDAIAALGLYAHGYSQELGPKQ